VVIGGSSAAAGTFTTATATTGNITTVNATTVDSTNVEVTNLKAKDGTASATIADVTGVMTVASAVLTTADINGGTADAVVIGGTTPAAGTFTSLNATGGGALTGTWSNLGSVTTIDINGGTIDGAVIGGSSAAAGSFTTISASGTITGPSGTWDAGGVDIATGDTYAINSVDVLSATTLGSSVVNSSLTSLGTITSLVATTADINGGSIDGTTIGSTTASTGNFSTLSIGGTAITATAAELNYTDGVTSNIQTQLDAKAPLASPTFTGTVTIPAATVTGDVSFGDNDKAIFGAGSDLQIYHNGSHSIIADAGTGHLKLLAADLRINNAADTETFIAAYENSKVDIYYDNSVKLTTTSTGIDVTGTATMDGLTVDGDASVITLNNTDTSLGIGQTLARIDVKQNDPSDQGVGVVASIEVENRGSIQGAGQFNFKTGGATSLADRMSISEGGDISFYEDTGTTPKFFWDASAESLGIGTTSPAANLVSAGSSSTNFKALILRNGDGTTGSSASIDFEASSGTQGDEAAMSGRIAGVRTGAGTSGALAFSTTNGGVLAERARIDSSGNVGIGTSSPTGKVGVEIGASSNNGFVVSSANNALVTGNHFYAIALRGDTSAYNLLKLENSVGTKMIVQGNGNVGIGTSTPNADLELGGTGEVLRLSGSSTNAYIRNTDGTTNQWYIGSGGNAGLQHYIYAAQPMTFHTSGLERLRIDSSGNVGIGTTSPGGRLQIGGTTADSSNILMFGKTEYAAQSTLPYISQVSATTPGTTNDLQLFAGGSGAGRIINNSFDFVVKTGGGTSPSGTERMRIDSSGNLLVGTTDPDVAFGTSGGSSLQSNGQAHHSSSGTALVLNRTASDGTIAQFRKAGTTVGSISVTTSATAYNTSSDQRLKENIADADDAGSKVDAIQVRQFDWKADGNHQDYGMIAQELVTVAPEAVSVPEDPEEMMGVDYSKLVPMLVKEIQSLRARVAQLEGGQ